MRIKHLVYYILLICVPLVFTELSLRAYFSVIAGPNVFFYGTRFGSPYRSIDRDSYKKKKKAEIKAEIEKNHSVMFHENVTSNYSKYFPNQERVDHDEYGEIFKATINRQGFRGKDFTDHKDQEVVRIITLGASSTFGYHDRDDETYPYILERLLEKSLLNHKCAGIKSFEVFNFGIPHLHSHNISSLFLSEAVNLKPDIITFYEGINDSAIRNKPSPSLFSKLFSRVSERLIASSLVNNLFITNIEEYSEHDYNLHIQNRSEHFIKYLSLIYEECKKRDILFIVATQQAKSHLIKKENIKGITYEDEVKLVKSKLFNEGKISLSELYFLTHNIIMEELKKWAYANNIPIVDVIKALDQRRDYLLSWVHLSPRANRIVASEFTKEILRHVCTE